MTRIYTNVPAMIARNNLNLNMGALSTSLERLSTGFKINSGKDDPAGLIASEMLRSDITGIKAAVKNTERANMMIATADSALNEVTNLLNDVRGLVTEAASTATMSAEMIYANQLQVNASLDAIDRIAAQTTFMGQKLLDGSLDFNLAGIDRNSVQGLSVHQVTFGANKGAMDVSINVREAAEKAALYYNQPALAESIVLNWGGVYGYDMETFEKGASVSEIAEIVNKRSDSTGVVAEVGSDALKGLLYVSSLGEDNDIIIDAGLAGLNEGNVEIKYLKGSSEGVQVVYEEPTSPGAPAKLLVYLQTEAYESAFADDIDTTWTMQNGKLAPLRDNNALKFDSTIEGDYYNGANIYYVDGSLTDPKFFSSENPTGTPGMPYTYFSDTGQSSSALFGYVPGADSVTGVNGTALAFNGLSTGEYFAVQSRAAGSKYNDTTIQFVAADASDKALNGRKAAAVYGEQTSVTGEVLDKTLTIYYNNDGNTSLQDIQEALRLEQHIGKDGVLESGSFEIISNTGTKKLTDVTLANAPTGQRTWSTTHNSGGEAGSLFIVLPPDGKMPKSPDIPEEAGTTAKAVGDGLYLAHKDPLWDGYTFEFVHNKTVTSAPDVSVTYDVNTKKVLIVANGNASYQEIVDELNDVSRPPELQNAGELYWSDVNGEPTTPGVPKALASATRGGVVGRSTTPLVNINNEALYLHHNTSDLDNYSIEFVSVAVPADEPFVSVGSSGNKITVSHNAHATYEDILAELNKGVGPSTSVNAFSWVRADGTPFSGTPYRSSAQVDTGVYLSNSPAWNGYTVSFSDTGTTPASVSVDNAVKTITVNYNSGGGSAASDILTALNDELGGGFDGFNWVDVNGSPTTAPTTFASVQLGTVGATGTDSIASKTLPSINTGKMQVRTTVPLGDNFYLAHENPAWNAFSYNFVKTGETGGSAKVEFDDSNRIITVTVDNDTKYETILDALNDTSKWTVTNPFSPPSAVNVPNITAWESATGLTGRGGLRYVNSNGDPVTPGLPTQLIASTVIGEYRPEQFSEDGKSDLIGTLPDGSELYLQHFDKSWDGLDIKFTTADAGIVNPPIGVNFDGKTINVVINSTASVPVTYDDILAALNHPLGTMMIDGITPIDAWRRPDGTAIPTNQLPKADDLRWVGADGRIEDVTNPVAGGAGSGDAGIQTILDALKIAHLDPKWDNLSISLAPTTAATNPPGAIEISRVNNSLTVSYDGTASLTYQNLLDALNGNWTGKPEGIKDLTYDTSAATLTSTLPTSAVNDAIIFGEVTYTTGALEPYPPLNHVVDAGSVYRDITANDISAMFDLNNPLSRGSERAASLFDVASTVDNDGTGIIRLYDYWIDANGNPVDADSVDPAKHTQVYTKTAFENAFQEGVTGGEVITTAAELVTVLNNSAFWGQIQCPPAIAELAVENAAGNYHDMTDPPVITARLAPGNNGYFAVSTFEEVAYYGNPDDGTALQFLGENNSPNIRFVVDGPNSELYAERTSVPAVEGQAQAVLTAQDSGASLTITAVGKGEAYDDVQFVFKRVSEDAKGLLDPDRKDGWVEYDPGSSFASAQATFRDATTNQTVENTAFYVTSTERGDQYNNVEVMMRLDDAHASADPIVVAFDSSTNQLRVSIDSTKAHLITTNDVVAAINNAGVDFKAELSYAESPLNDGTGKLSNVGLTSSRYTSVANTGETGGHQGGTVTVWLADSNPGPGGPEEIEPYVNPTQEDIVRLINDDPVVSKMFVARAYNTVQGSDGKQIDFVQDGPIVTQGGLVEPALITVHLAADSAGNVITTAKDLETWWNLQDPELVDHISASIVRPAGAVWDDCNDPYGNGLLAPTISRGECDEWIINDIQFVGWDDNADQQHYVAKNSSGTMTSQRGINSSYQLIAKNLGSEWDGFTIEYIDNKTLTGRFVDNLVDGSNINPCDDEIYSGLLRDASGNIITPNTTTEKGLQLVYDETSKKITIHVNFGNTTANDIQQLINSDPRVRNKFEVAQLGDGTGLIDRDDNTLITTGGAAAPGVLNGAKLLFGSDATDYYLIFKSKEYGSDQFVDVKASALDGGNTTFSVTDKNGQISEKAYGKDVDALVNGISAVGDGLGISMDTSALSLDFTFGENAGTTQGYSTGFTITGGGATFQVGPDVVSRQQITMGIRSINTVQLGGVSGVLNQLRSGQDANLTDDPNKAFRIVEESLLAITTIRGRLGTMQKATLETNINVLNDTLTAITEAESQIRDTDFAEETSNMTRAQILVQASMSTLGVANQIPNYMLSLLGG